MSLICSDIRNYIFVYDLLSEEECDTIIARLERRKKWRDHKWYDAGESNYTTDADFQTARDPRCKDIIFKHIPDLLDAYCKEYYVEQNTNSHINWSTTSDFKFNKYSVGDSIEPHHDHIHDMFDGNVKGIPLTSLVGVLNDDYEGGEFLFWREHHVPLKKGQVAAFPSNFMYPHEVTEITSGTRYSWVTWCV